MTQPLNQTSTVRFGREKRAGKTLTAAIQNLTVLVQMRTNNAKNLNFRDKNLNISIQNLTNEVKRNAL